VANLISLRGQLDPVASESRLKSFIATQPEAALLHFSLGNQYAQQSRWSEAQAAYFKAHSVDPENATTPSISPSVSISCTREAGTRV